MIKKGGTFLLTFLCIGLISCTLGGCRLLDLLMGDDSLKKNELAGQSFVSLNENIIDASTYGGNLLRFPTVLNGKQVSSLIREQLAKMVSLRATGAVREAGLITDSAIKRIEDKVGFNTIPDKTPAFFAIAQKRLEPMLGPTTSVWYQDKTHRDYNVLKTGEIIAGEAVAVMHISTDKTFCYVQSASARGWVPYYDLLFTGHILWLEIVSPSDFAVVVAPRYNLMEKGHVYDYYMGDVIILDRKKSTFDRPYGLFPVKKEGVLAFESVELSNKHVHVGYLKATEENLKAQTKIYEKAFLENLEKDKSSHESLLMRSRVYRSIGVRLPSDENSQCRVMTLLPFFNNMQSEYLKPLNCQEEYYDFRPL